MLQKSVLRHAFLLGKETYINRGYHANKFHQPARCD